jgi:pectate lyase
MRLSKIRKTLSKTRKPAITGAITVAITVAIAVAIAIAASIFIHTNMIESYISPNNTFGFAFVEGKGLKTTTGGKNGKKFVIDGDEKEFRDLCDDLRDDNEPSIIILRGSFDFKGDDKVELPSNCTVFGENCKIRGGLNIDEKSNIIIQNIFFEDAEKYGEQLDNIQITEGSHHIWVDHCTFTKTGDGLIDIKNESSYVTVSWCKFGKYHNKTMLIGSSDSNKKDKGNLKVTLHHNWFAGDSRNPRIRFGVVHAFNNFYDNNKSYGIASVLGAKAYIQSNYFENVKNELDIDLDGKYDSDDEGEIFNINNFGIDYDSDDENELKELPYSNYSVDKAKDVKNIVKKEAGVQDKKTSESKKISESKNIRKTKKLLITVAATIFVLALILLIYVITKKSGTTSAIINTPELY